MRKKAASSRRVGVSRAADWRVGRIISMIASGRHPNCRTLAEEIEVSQKTIQRDLDHMRNARNLPLEYDDKKHGYYFTAPVSEFAPMQFSVGELVALFVAAKAVEPLRGTKIYRLVMEGLRKITDASPQAAEVKWHELDAAFSMKSSGVLKSDVVIFTKLVNAVTGRRELRFHYHKLKGSKPEPRRAQPYHVGRFENGWYLIARDLERAEMRTFALQRMSDLRVLGTRFRRDPDFDLRRYLDSGFGVWSYAADAEPVEVRLIFTGWAARVVAERHWHDSQRITALDGEGGGIEFRARVAGLEEITRWVLGFGRHANVLSPAKLRNAVLEEALAIARHGG
jgi:predicted DNA-binding transcriptional regulator YafY